MEKLQFSFDNCRPVSAGRRSTGVLVGVVASGNLEVLVERGAEPHHCRFNVKTAAAGFGDIWTAVLEDFIQRHEVGGLTFSINDAGATPAVVMLRLQQVMSEWKEPVP